MSSVLLVVDDREDLRNGYFRYFARFFDEVCLAADPVAAETFLCRKDNPPTHLICDYWFGESHPVGAQIVPRWRRICPSIVRAALVSGSQVTELPATEGIDGVFEKPLELKCLRAFLLGTAE